MSSGIKLAVAVVAATFGGAALAAVSADEAKKLGGAELTAWGAEKAGNKDGTIPAYTGERPKAPAGYNPKEPGNYPDPYTSEKPLFSITAQNAAQYADKLTDGQKEMFKRYPSYRMDIYPTHRTSIHAPYIVENTVKNATACKAVNNNLRLEGCYGGFPFPIPKNGNEAVWNHVMSLPAHAWSGRMETYVVDASGKLILQGALTSTQEAPFLDPGNKGVLASNSFYYKLRFDADGPARKVGEKTLVLDSLDPLDPGRRAYSYIPGQRRVKLAPDLAYDTPSPVSGGSSTMDEARVFFGAQDRYNMKLVGKKEVFLMYNNFKLTDYRVCPNAVSHIKNFLNPDCVRWELHRAWVVEATLKPGFRHVLPKRVMYFDEDSWAAAVGDAWDAAGKIYRIDNEPLVPFLDLPHGQIADMTATYDLQTGIISTTAGAGFPGGHYHPVPSSDIPKGFFTPESMAGEGVR